jgi:hypothetical protein
MEMYFSLSLSLFYTHTHPHTHPITHTKPWVGFRALDWIKCFESQQRKSCIKRLCKKVASSFGEWMFSMLERAARRLVFTFRCLQMAKSRSIKKDQSRLERIRWLNPVCFTGPLFSLFAYIIQGTLNQNKYFWF